MDTPKVGASETHCQHLQVSSDCKPSCIECGLGIEITGQPYIRSISHYRQLYNAGKIYKINEIANEGLQQQVKKFLERQHRTGPFGVGVVGGTSDPKDEWGPPEGVLKYINFLRENRDKILPKKNRAKGLNKIYGEHRRLITSYVIALGGSP